MRTGEPELWPSIPAELARSDRTRRGAPSAPAGPPAVGRHDRAARRARRGARRGETAGHGRPAFDEDDLGSPSRSAPAPAIALDNARLYADRDTVARTLQQSLLPPTLPEIPGLDLAARYRPGGRGARGRRRLLRRLPDRADDGWSVLGDVCGKGVEAAGLTAAGPLHRPRTAAGRSSAPAACWRRSTQILLEDGADRFATVVLVRLRRDDRRLGRPRSAPAGTRCRWSARRRHGARGGAARNLRHPRMVRVADDRAGSTVATACALHRRRHRGGAHRASCSATRTASRLPWPTRRPHPRGCRHRCGGDSRNVPGRETSNGSPTSERDDMAVLVARVR